MRTNELTNNYRGIGIIAADPHSATSKTAQVCNLRLAAARPGRAPGALRLSPTSLSGEPPGVACAEHLTRRMTIVKERPVGRTRSDPPAGVHGA